MVLSCLKGTVAYHPLKKLSLDLADLTFLGHYHLVGNFLILSNGLKQVVTTQL